MNNAPNKVIFLLPFAFMLHNGEEALTLSRVNLNINTPYPYTLSQFVIAVILFTILGFVLVFFKGIYKKPEYYTFAITGFAGMLFLNVFLPHLIISLLTLSYTPGLISAVFILLPLTSIILWKTYQSKRLSGKQIMLSIATGGIIGSILVAIFLGVGRLISSLFS